MTDLRKGWLLVFLVFLIRVFVINHDQRLRGWDSMVFVVRAIGPDGEAWVAIAFGVIGL